MSGQTSTLRIWAFGSARVVRDGRMLSTADWIYAQSKDLLFYLLCYGLQTSEQLEAVFWPNEEPARRRHHLELTVHHLRRALGNAEWITFERGAYVFNRCCPYWFDVEVFEQRVAEAGQLRRLSPIQAIRPLEEASALYKEALVAGAPWGQPRHNELHRTYNTALQMLEQVRNERGELARLVDARRRVNRSDAPVESARHMRSSEYELREESDLTLRHTHMIAKYA